MTEESHLGIEIVLQIRVPVEVISFKIGENGMGRAECADIIRHETRNFDDDVALLESPLPYHPNRLSERHIEIAREEDLSLSVLLPEEFIEDPCGCRLAVRPGHGEDFETFWEEWIHEIQLTDNLASRIDSVRWGDTRRRDNRTIARKVHDIIRIIHYLRSHIVGVTKSPQGVSDFSFTVNTDHNLEKMGFCGIIRKIYVNISKMNIKASQNTPEHHQIILESPTCEKVMELKERTSQNTTDILNLPVDIDTNYEYLIGDEVILEILRKKPTLWLDIQQKIKKFTNSSENKDNPGREQELTESIMAAFLIPEQDSVGISREDFQVCITNGIMHNKKLFDYVKRRTPVSFMEYSTHRLAQFKNA